MKKRPGKHTLLWWMNLAFLILLCICGLVLTVFVRMSRDNLMAQKIETQGDILKLNVDNVNENLASMENYLLQTFGDSVEIVNIETLTDETKLFMAKQSIVRSLKKIVAWSDLRFLFCYSPKSPGEVFIRVSQEGGNLQDKLELSEQIRAYIDLALSEQNYLGDGYLLTNVGDMGYVIRFYRVRNSYFGMCMDAETVLEPLEGLYRDQDCAAFLCDIDGKLIYPAEKDGFWVDIAQNGQTVELDGEKYLQLNYLSGEGDFYIGTWTKISEVARQTGGMMRLILAFAFGVLLFLASLSVVAYRMLCRPIQEMERSMKRVGSGDWDIAVKEDSGIAEYDSMIRNFNEMVSEIRNLKIQSYEKELDRQKLQLWCLQMQVNPHFYLNALNIIYSMAQVHNFEVVQEMAMSLVEYSRYMFRSPDSLVTVAQEMEHVDNYMKIQQIRFPKRIDYRAVMNSEIEDALIPPFMIQSFVENSMKYAVSFEQHNKVRVLGKVEELDRELYVHIEIRDNGTGYSREVMEMLNADAKPQEDGRQVGIRNVKARLALVFGEKAKVILKNEDGAVTILRIPLTWEE